MFLARVVVEDAHDHQRVGAREARAPLGLRSIDGDGRSVSDPIRSVFRPFRIDPPAPLARSVGQVIVPPRIGLTEQSMHSRGNKRLVVLNAEKYRAKSRGEFG